MNNEKTQLLKKLQAASFGINEAALYLDGHPTNKLAHAYYDKTKKEYETLMQKYETTYGPLTFYNAGGPSWTWIQGPWPWQHESEV